MGRDVAENVLEAMAEQMIAHFGYGLVTDNDKALAAAMLRAGLEAAGYGKVDELRVLYTLEQAAPPTSDGR